MRNMTAIITITEGRGSTRQFPVQRVQNYATEQSIDNDADTFSVDIGDSSNALVAALERDNEVRVALFLDDVRGKLHPIFSGIADTAQKEQDKVLSIDGRDVPSAIAVDSDAMPGRFPHTLPKQFITSRAAALGITNVAIADMSSIRNLYTDGSETEWQFWYRMARTKGMYMWSDNRGRLIIDKLGYAVVPTYHFGDAFTPGPKNRIPVEEYTLMSNKQQRVRRVLMYGTNAKTGAQKSGMVQQSVDTSIRGWKKKPLLISSNTTAKTPKTLKTEADDDMFESIVGAQEHTIKIRDTGSLIQQNRMARLTLADEGIDDLFFIVGVQRQGGPDGMTQIIRLREKGFAISDRVPDAPIITTAKDSSKNKSSASIAEAIATIGGGTIRWSDSFVRATNEFGVPAGWDFSLFLGVLLSICEKETHFQNIRQTPTSPTKSEHAGTEWYPQPKTQDLPTVYAQSPGGPVYSASPPSVAELVTQWRHTFANQQNNPLNPFYPGGEAGVGPMQLTTLGIKQDADGFGWSGAAKPGEYDGGRWNPDSNIRAAAKALADKGKVQPAVDPTNDSDIWIAVARYNGGGQQAQQYAAAVQAIYNVSYKKQIPSALAPLVGLAPGTTQTNVKMPDGSTLVLPDTTPPEARKAIAFCLARQGDPYQWAGNGPLYDCSSLVTAALNSAAGYLRAMLGSPGGGVKPLRETSYTLFTKGRFQAVTKDNLLPADLVFFTGSDGDENNPGHVGMYLNNGLFIQDPKTGDVVKISSLGEDYYRETYVGARRLVVWPTVGTAGGPH